MFNFKIIQCADSIQIIDSSLTTPYGELTPDQMQEYMEIDTQIAVMERMRRKAQRESDHKRKMKWNPLYKVASMCGFA